MPITLRCGRCKTEKKYSFGEFWEYTETEFRQQRIGDKYHLLCQECLKSHDHLVRVINEKHQEEKQKSLELWLNSKHY